MRVAALYDIHGNLPALEAVIRDALAAGVDQVVVGGDVVPGPMPREALDRLLDLEVPVRFLHGNGESAVLAELAGTGSPAVPEELGEVIRWTARQLDADHDGLLAAWPGTLTLDVPGLGEVLFCHATPRSDTEIFTRETPEDRLLPIFGGVDEPFVVCGHTHMQFDRVIGGTRVVNAGSVGMPFGKAGADWLLLGSGVELRHTAYDLAAAAERIRGTSYPQAREFAARSVLDPPSEEEMLEVLSKADLTPSPP